MKQPAPPGLAQEHEQPPDIDPLLTVLGRLHPVSPSIALYLRDHVTSLSVRKRKLLLREEGICQHVYFIKKGAIRGFTREGHKEITTWINVENQLVSSIFSLNNKEPSTENIQALENCELLIMTYDDLENLYEQIPESNVLARKLLQVYYQDAERRAFIARLTKAEKKTTYVPGEAYNPYPLYGDFYGYYSTMAPLVYAPGYMVKEKLAQVETNFYSTAKPSGELVWTGTTNTFDGNSPMKAIKGLVKVVIEGLEKENVISRKP